MKKNYLLFLLLPLIVFGFYYFATVVNVAVALPGDCITVIKEVDIDFPGNGAKQPTIIGDKIYMLDEYGKIAIYNISNPELPVLEKTLTVTSPWDGQNNWILKAAYDPAANYAYIASTGTDSIIVVDLNEDDGNNAEVERIFGGNFCDTHDCTGGTIDPVLDDDMNFPQGIAFHDDYLFVASRTSPHALSVIDVSTPTSPFGITTITGLPTYPVDIEIYDDGINVYAYVISTGDGGSGALSIIDITTPATPVLKSTFDNSTSPNINNLQMAWGIDVVEIGAERYAFIVNEDDPATLSIIKVTAPNAPVGIAELINGSDPIIVNMREARDVKVIGNYAYVTSGLYDGTTGALSIIDISDLTNPVGEIEVGSTGGEFSNLSALYFMDVYDSGGDKYIYIANRGGSDKLTVAKASDSCPATLPCANHNVFGYAWSENIGWISFSCEDTMVIGTGVDYGVDICEDDADPLCSAIVAPKIGKFTGYAWSENIGWIDFAPIGPYPDTPNFSVRVDVGGVTCGGIGKVCGWARACSVFQSGCSGALDSNRGGWDGWINLRNDAIPYGVSIDASTGPSAGDFSGWAWSDMVAGWIKFKNAAPAYKVETTFNFPITNNPPSVSGLSDPDNEFYSYCIGGTSNGHLEFHWTYNDSLDVPPDSQAEYQLQIATDNSFVSKVADCMTSSVIPDGGTGVIGFDIIEGVIPSPASSNCGVGKSINYNQTYYWRIRVTDERGAVSEWSDAGAVDPVEFDTPEFPYPDPSFEYSPTEPRVKEEIQFTDTTTFYGGAGGETWAWDFGDGDNSSIQNPTHTYDTTGDKTVTLEACQNGLCCPPATDTIGATISLPEWYPAD